MAACEILTHAMSKNRIRSPHVGRNIRRRRRELELTQPDLAAAVQLHINTINRIERGHRGVDLDVLSRLAEALRTTMADLTLRPSESEARS